jgi:hypothetical protein
MERAVQLGESFLCDLLADRVEHLYTRYAELRRAPRPCYGTRAACCS